MPQILAAHITEDTLSIELADGRTVSAPLGWYPRLAAGGPRRHSISNARRAVFLALKQSGGPEPGSEGNR
jgi:hypothetical protein